MSRANQTQAHFQTLAAQRLKEAEELLNVKCWDGAYYLAGYAIELGLKACIIKSLRNRDEFPEKDFSKDCYTHNLKKLRELARIDEAFEVFRRENPAFETNWLVVKDWSEQSRYQRIEEQKARSLLDAITQERTGVWPWIQTQW